MARRPLEIPVGSTDWVEQPPPTFPQRSWCDLSDGGIGPLVGPRGLPEAEAIPGDPPELAVTLLRCVGWLSRDDLSTRRGHAGPPIPTPGAQEEGTHRFQYTIVPHADGWESAFREAFAFETPMRAETARLHAGPLPADGSFLKVSPSYLVVSAVKRSERGGLLVVRAYNVGDHAVNGRFRPQCCPKRAVRLSLAEEEQGSLAVGDDGWVGVSIGTREVVTLGFEV